MDGAFRDVLILGSTGCVQDAHTHTHGMGMVEKRKGQIFVG